MCPLVIAYYQLRGSSLTAEDRMRLAALTVFGDPKNSEDWDVFDVPMFTVLPKDKRCRKKRGTNKTSQSKPGGN